MEKLALFVAAHKKININKYPGRKIIYTGGHIEKNERVHDGRIFYDDEGDNISSMNKYYSEVSALYWIYKNYHDAEYVGLEHYRRVFKRNIFKIASVDYLYNKAKKYDIIHKPNWYHIRKVKTVMNKDGAALYSILENAIKKNHPEFLNVFYKKMNAHYCKYCNTIIMKKELFDQYMKFMFEILFECDKHISEIDEKHQLRSIGYLAERLLDPYIEFRHLSHHKNLLKRTKRYKIKQEQ